MIEGTHNGMVERSFYPTIFFAGSINPGVSGGPTLDQRGRVIGVNVAARRDGEQVSFLVPSLFAEELLERGRDSKPITAPAYPELTRQLMAHQEALTVRFLGQPWRHASHPRYVIPLPQEDFMRCWGRSTSPDEKGMEFERSDCMMDSRVFVSGWLTTGTITTRHEAYDGRRLGALRFAQRYSASFKNEQFGGPARELTTPQCTERYVDRNGLPVRVVLCMAAYKKLVGLYDASVLVATVDAPRVGVLGRFDARGVSFDNALRLTAHYVEDSDGRRRSRRATEARGRRDPRSRRAHAPGSARVAVAGDHRPGRRLRHRPRRSVRGGASRDARQTSGALVVQVGETVNGAMLPSRRSRRTSGPISTPGMSSRSARHGCASAAGGRHGTGTTVHARSATTAVPAAGRAGQRLACSISPSAGSRSIRAG